MIRGPECTVELYSRRAPHPEADAGLHLPEEQIPFMGDLLLLECHSPLWLSQMDGLLQARSSAGCAHLCALTRETWHVNGGEPA